MCYFTGGEIWPDLRRKDAAAFGRTGGQIADRLISTEKLLAPAGDLAGGIASAFALAFAENLSWASVVMLAYQLAYMLTIPLTNAICFHHTERAKPASCAQGTIGWIAARPGCSYLQSLAGSDRAASHSRRASAASFTVAGIALTLTCVFIDAPGIATGTAR